MLRWSLIFEPLLKEKSSNKDLTVIGLMFLAVRLNAIISVGERYGYLQGWGNKFNRVQEALACALGWSLDGVVGLFHFPVNPYCHLYRNEETCITDFF